MDLATKKPITVKVTTDSQMHQLPAMMAQRIAMRLKGISPQSAPGTGAAQPPAAAAAGAPSHSWNGGGGTGGNGNGGTPDLQRMLGRTPTVSLAELKKGDAVMIVSTEGTGDAPANCDYVA